MLPLSVIGNEYVLGDEKLKAVWASASKDKAGRTHISLVNIDAHNTQEVLIDVNGGTYKDISGRILKSDKLQNYNSFEKPNTIVPVEFKEATLANNKIQVKLPPFSVVVLELK
jgi:alpha-N-arabinofuranosidase